MKMIRMGPFYSASSLSQIFPGFFSFMPSFSLFFLSRVPLKIFSLTLYPLSFAILFVFLSGFRIYFILLIFLKVLCGSTGVVLLLATTPYPLVFRVLGRFLPSLFVTALFLTYRSVFILLNVFEETEHAIHLRRFMATS
jgi:hypothetical protein